MPGLQAYPAYRIFEGAWFDKVPNHWKTARLRYVARVGNGTTPARDRNEYWLNGSIPWLASGQANDYFVRKAREYVTPVAVKESSLRILPAGSVIIGMVGQGKTRGMSAYMCISATINQNLAGITPRSELDGRYLHYTLNAAYPFLRSRGRGGNQAALNCGIIGSITSLLPPRAEQEQIVAYLRAYDAHISRFIKVKRQLISLLTEQKLRIIDRAVTRSIDASVKLKLSGVSWLGEMPEHWEAALLKHVAEVRFSGVDKHSHNHETPVRLCNYTDVYKNDRIIAGMDLMHATATRSEIARFTLRAGDVIVTKDSETPDDIGVPAWVPADLPGVICGYHLGLLRADPKRVLGEFLFRVIGSARVARQFHVLATGVTRFALSKHDIKNAIIPLPPLDEQETICRWIDSECGPVDEAIRRARDEIKLIREYRDRLIADVVTGQVDVRGWQPGPDDLVGEEDLVALGHEGADTTDEEDADGDN